MRAALLSLVLLPALAGCFTIASTITVRPDGSGVIRDSVSVRGLGALAMEGEDKADGELVAKAQLQARAAALGDGVTLLGMEATETGYVAFYSFPDIEALQYVAPDISLGDDDDAKTVTDEALTLSFDFEPGDTATLRITVPDEAQEATGTPGVEQTDAERAEAAQGIRLMRALLGDAQIRVAVVVEGDVIETDAAFADGPAITVVDLVFDDVLDVMEEHPELIQPDSSPVGQLQALLAGREGVAIQPPGTVTVRFE